MDKRIYTTKTSISVMNSSMHQSRSNPKNQPQISLPELKHQTLSLMTKLNSKEGVTVASKYLLQLYSSIEPFPEHLSLFLATLMEVGESPAIYYRKEVLRILAVSVVSQNESVYLYSNRMISTVCKFLKDSDDSLREICAEFIEILYQNAPQALPLISFFKPFFAIICDNKQVQIGISLCLASLFKVASKEELEKYFKELHSKLLKILRQPICPGNFSVLQAVIQLIAVTNPFLTIPELPSTLGCIVELFKSSEWITRKVSAESISHLVQIYEDCPSALLPFRAELVQLLETIRYDKIKQVRDSTLQSIKMLSMM